MRNDFTHRCCARYVLHEHSRYNSHSSSRPHAYDMRQILPLRRPRHIIETASMGPIVLANRLTLDAYASRSGDHKSRVHIAVTTAILPVPNPTFRHTTTCLFYRPSFPTQFTFSFLHHSPSKLQPALTASILVVILVRGR